MAPPRRLPLLLLLLRCGRLRAQEAPAPEADALIGLEEEEDMDAAFVPLANWITLAAAAQQAYQQTHPRQEEEGYAPYVYYNVDYVDYDDGLDPQPVLFEIPSPEEQQQRRQQQHPPPWGFFLPSSSHQQQQEQEEEPRPSPPPLAPHAPPPASDDDADILIKAHELKWVLIALMLIAGGACATSAGLLTVLVLLRRRHDRTPGGGGGGGGGIGHRHAPNGPRGKPTTDIELGSTMSADSTSVYLVEPSSPHGAFAAAAPAADSCCQSNGDDDEPDACFKERHSASWLLRFEAEGFLSASHIILSGDIEYRGGRMGIANRLGIGGYGEVYQGKWRGTHVAVKRLLDQQGIDVLEEFTSEVRILSRLRHPRVVLWMGVIVEPNDLSIVTEFMDKGSLGKVLHGTKPRVRLPLSLRARWSHDIAEGMAYLHGQRIIHRDLTPNNVLVNRASQVKITDFGLSKIKSSRSQHSSGRRQGAAFYCAPEVLANEPYDYPCDVFSFGILLWELMHRRVPFVGQYDDVLPFMAAMQRDGSSVATTALQWGDGAEVVQTEDEWEENGARLLRALADVAARCWRERGEERPAFVALLPELKQLA